MSALNKEPHYGFHILPAMPADQAVLDADAPNLRYVFYIDPPPIRTLTFKGGGSRVIVYTKFLEMADHYGLLDTVEEIGGSSSGSIAATFAAIHYEDPAKRTETLNAISNVDKADIYGETKAWKAYQVMTSPLLLISKPFEWLAKGINWLADRCMKNLPGKFIGIPLKILSIVPSLISFLTSPRTYAGLANLIVRGGVYRGDKFQQCIRQHIQDDTQAGVDAMLGKMNDDIRMETLDHLLEIGLLKLSPSGLKVVADVTPAHFHALSKLPGSKFKQYYATTMRVRDKALVVFNHETAPDLPIHFIERLAITFPGYYQAITFNGDKYIDGGAIDNSPIERVKPKPVTAFMQEHEITDKISRLNVRVEYPQDSQFHLWDARPALSMFGRFMHNLKRSIAKIFTKGVDSFEMDAQVNEVLRRDYAHRTIQLPDFGIGQMENNISAEKRARIENELPDIINNYFSGHHSEKAVMKNFSPPVEQTNYPDRNDAQPKVMPLPVRMKLIATLQDQRISSSELFDFPNKSIEELDELRRTELARILNLPSTREYQLANQHGSSAQVMRAVGFGGQVNDGEYERVEMSASGNDNNTRPVAAASLQQEFNYHVPLINRF